MTVVVMLLLLRCHAVIFAEVAVAIDVLVGGDVGFVADVAV